jgi:hypothetical protein
MCNILLSFKHCTTGRRWSVVTETCRYPSEQTLLCWTDCLQICTGISALVLQQPLMLSSPLCLSMDRHAVITALTPRVICKFYRTHQYGISCLRIVLTVQRISISIRFGSVLTFRLLEFDKLLTDNTYCNFAISSDHLYPSEVSKGGK